MRAASDDDTMLDAERKASPFCAERAIVVNGPEKRVYRQSDTVQTSPIGFIKEEIVRGKDGAEVSRTYYDRNGWRDHGQACFYGKILVEGRGVYCLDIGGVQIDEAVTRAFIAALEPAKLAATVAAAERLEADRETSLRQWRLGVERASFEASRAERRYRAVDPDNRLVARGLEREWEERLSALEAAKAELSRREEARPPALSQDERGRLLALGADLAAVWRAATTTPRDQMAE